MVKLIKKNPIVVIFATYIVIEVCKVTGFVCGPPIQRYFDLSNTQLGLILSALSLGALLMNMGVGHLADYMGLWGIWKLGIIGTIVSIFIFLFAGGFWGVFIPLFLLGIMHVLTLNANNTYLTGEYKENNLHIMGLASGLWFGSSVISTPLIGLWVEYANKANLGRMMFLVPYTFDIFLLLIVLFIGNKLAKPLITKTDCEDRKNAEKNRGKRANEKRNIFEWFAILVIAYCHGSMVVGIVSWINPMVQSKFGVTDFYGSLTFAVFALSLAVGRLTIASGIIKPSTRKMLAINGITGGIILSIAMFLPGFWITVGGIAAGGLAVSTTAPGLLALVAEQFPVTRSHVYGHTGVSICTAAFLTPSIIGTLSDYGMDINTALLISPFSAIILGATSIIWEMKEYRKKLR